MRSTRPSALFAVAVSVIVPGAFACSSSSSVTVVDGGADGATDAVTPGDAGKHDSGKPDAARNDASKPDAKKPDATPGDATTSDAGDSGFDATPDGSFDATLDGSVDGSIDATSDGSFDGGSDAPIDGGDAGEPTLTSLTVTGSDAAPTLTLVPAFSPNIHDYYVRCAAGANPIGVSATASAGATAILEEGDGGASDAGATETETFTVAENGAIVAVAREGGRTSEYWVRCLPHDFPELGWTAHPENGTPPPGYYLLGNLTPSTSTSGYAMVLDGNGVPVWYYAAGPSLGVSDVDLDVATNSLSFIPSSSAFAPEFQFVPIATPGAPTLVAPEGFTTDGHELRILPDGDFLVFSYPLIQHVDLSSLTVGGNALTNDETIADCRLVKFQADGTVVSTWSAYAHLDPNLMSTVPTGPSPAGAYDVFHCNSIDVDAANGNVLISARNTDSIFYVDWQNGNGTGNVLWKLGGVASSRDPGTVFVENASPFYRQHDARLQPGWSASCNGGSGQISLFDDESSISGALARGVAFDVVVGGGDSACDAGAGIDGGGLDSGNADGGFAGRARVAWQFQGISNTAATGSFRITADGSRVIDWGLGTPEATFSEVNLGGERLVDFKFTGGATSYRTVKVPLAALDLGTMRKTAGTASGSQHP